MPLEHSNLFAWKLDYPDWGSQPEGVEWLAEYAHTYLHFEKSREELHVTNVISDMIQKKSDRYVYLINNSFLMCCHRSKGKVSIESDNTLNYYISAN